MLYNIILSGDISIPKKKKHFYMSTAANALEWMELRWMIIGQEDRDVTHFNFKFIEFQSQYLACFRSSSEPITVTFTSYPIAQ
jgi:hypothetical protein